MGVGFPEVLALLLLLVLVGSTRVPKLGGDEPAALSTANGVAALQEPHVQLRDGRQGNMDPPTA
jgi:hypothetical protein